VTEIPEHLLKRSQERRQAAAGTGGAGPPEATGTPEADGQPADSAAPTTAPAVPAAAAPARRGPTEPAAPPPPKPLPPYVLAAQSRKRVPFWAVPVLAGLPIWVFIYMEAMSPVKQQPTGALAVGAQVYNTCSACHGSGGEGGTGYKLNEGEVLKTFPKLEDQVKFVFNGSPGVGKPYGDPNRAGGQRISGALAGGQMIAWGVEGGLSAAQVVGAVCEERYVISGADPNDPKWQKEYADWCAPDAPKYAAALEATDGQKFVDDAVTAAASGSATTGSDASTPTTAAP
jgi:mono/diheme cytochrome c family protein